MEEFLQKLAIEGGAAFAGAILGGLAQLQRIKAAVKALEKALTDLTKRVDGVEAVNKEQSDDIGHVKRVLDRVAKKFAVDVTDPKGQLVPKK